MIGIPSLHEMVARELARRQEGDSKYPALSFIVNDGAGAMTDAEAAAKATIAAFDAKDIARRVTVTSSIAEAVVTALRAVHPRRMILMRRIVSSPLRTEELARPEIELEAGRDDDALQRAAERLAKLRDGAF
jgi:hypothetical protein